jgi:hypothetical protein
VQVACHFPEQSHPSEPLADNITRHEEAAMSTEELTVVNDGVTLHGTLGSPVGAGPHPAILAVHSASEPTRDERLLRHLQEVLPPNGIAVLTYDRRSHGASVVPADHPPISFEDKASDARAWLDLLGERPDIDSDRIGIWGHSQGGWLGPMAAVDHDDVKLMAFVGPSAVTPGEQMQFGYGYQIRQAGYSEEEAQRGIELRRLVDAYWRGDGVTEQEAIAAIDAASDEPWFDIAPPVDPRVSLGGWRTEVDLDITPTLARLNPMPILLIFGERDQWIPTEESERRWRRSLPSGADLTVERLPGTTHFPTPDHDGEGPLEPRYEELLVGWLREHFSLDGKTDR